MDSIIIIIIIIIIINIHTNHATSHNGRHNSNFIDHFFIQKTAAVLILPTTVLPSVVSFYYILHTQLFLQPQSVPHSKTALVSPVKRP